MKFFVNTDSVSTITDSSAVLYGWASSRDANCNSGSYPIKVTAIAAWSTNCSPVCSSYLGGLDTNTVVYPHSTCGAWVNNVITTIPLTNLQPSTTYYIRYIVSRVYYPDNFPPYATSFDPTYDMGNILQFTTKQALPSINNNIIYNNDKVVCPAGQALVYNPDTLKAGVPSGGNGSYSIIWQQKVDTSGLWMNCIGGTSSNYSPSSFAFRNTPYFTVEYRRIVQSGKYSDTSNTVTYTFLPPGYQPVINIKQADATKSLMTLDLSINNTIESYKISWYDSLIEKSSTKISQANSNQLYIPLNSQSPAHIYSAVVSYGGNCSSSKSKNIYISPPDGDGNYYPAVKIGNQTWMINNLRTTRLNNGVPLRKASKNKADYYWYNNDSLSYAKKFGALYDTTVISTQSDNVCPVGWKAAGIMDWYEMIDFIGGDKNAGALLKSESEWKSSDYQSNAYNFNALPTGEGLAKRQFEGNGKMATWWSVIPSSQVSGYIYNYAFIELIEADNGIYLVTPSKNNQNNTKHSIRCFTK
ncbi:MAG: FISUMP domain-containing protein [Bacteroidota bacterium]|nr:FISUMP domain-containing protein [Bacteroidota bacterium]